MNLSRTGFLLGERRATVSFLSRYRDENDFEVYCDGRYGRVRETVGGQVSSRSEHFTDAEAWQAVAAWRAADTEAFVRWQAAHLADAAR